MGFLFGSQGARQGFPQQNYYYGGNGNYRNFSPTPGYYPSYPTNNPMVDYTTQMQQYQSGFGHPYSTQTLHYPEMQPYQYDHANYGYQNPNWTYYQYNPYQQSPIPYQPFYYQPSETSHPSATQNQAGG